MELVKFLLAEHARQLEGAKRTVYARVLGNGISFDLIFGLSSSNKIMAMVIVENIDGG
jgi:hypothetical protein